LVGWEKSAAEQMSRLPPWLQFARALAVQEGSVRRSWCSEPERLTRFSPRSPLAAAKADQVGRVEKRRSSEPGLGRNGQGYRPSEMVVAVVK
jgi:hypothetical protein